METEPSLRCPLCLKQFHQPRLLYQCMHSFCNVCICSYVRPLLSADKALKTIPCPVCQTVFQGPSSSTELVNWVEQLPSDPLLNNSLERDAGDLQWNCEPCSVRGKQKKARKFCNECTEKLCEQCADVHMSFKGTRTHSLAEIDGTDCLVVDVEPLPICEYHEKKQVEYFCKDHEELVCSKCAVLTHRVCDIVELDTEDESLLNICSVEDIRSSFLSLKADLRDADTTVQEKNERFRTEVRDALLDIEDKRKKVNAGFDRLKENIAVEIKQHLKHAKEVKTDHERIATGIDNSLALLNTAEKKGKYIQMFSRGKVIARQIEGTRQRIKDYEAKYRSALFEYSFSPNVTAIINNTSALGTFSVRGAEATAMSSVGTDSFPAFCSDHTEYIERDNTLKSANSKQVETIKGGELKIIEVGTVKPKTEMETRGRTKIGIWGVATDSKKKGETITKTALDPTKVKVSQKDKEMSDKKINVGPWGMSVQPKAQTKVRVKTTKTIEIVLPDGSVPFFAGAAYLDDDRLLMTDVKYHRLLLFDRDLNYISKMGLKRQPRKVTVINKEKVAVGFNKDTLILIIKIGPKSMTISKRIYTSSPSKCVVSSNNRLFLSSYETVLEDEWHMTCFCLESDEEIDLDVQRVYGGAHMAVFNKDNKNYIVHSCRNDDSVKCHTDDGKEVFSYKLIGPAGVDVDRYGNIFVASMCRHKIMHLSPAGVLVKTLETGYLSRPYEVRMNLTHDKILVTQFESSKVHVLGLTYK